LGSSELAEGEHTCASSDGKKMKYYGFRSVTIRFLGGLEIKLWARYYARSQSRATKGKGAYFGLLLLGVYNRCSPALASEVAQLAAAMNLKELHIEEATKVLFIADGAKWIWTRVSAMFKRLGLKNEQCMELVDVYHVAEHLNAFAGLKKKWSKRQKRGRVTRQKNLLKAGDVASFKAAVRELSKGCRGKDWRRERNYLLRNAEAGRLNYGVARELQLPIGSGIIESTVRRVLNLRLKGASSFWTKANAEDMIFLRAYYKAGQWQALENTALTPICKLAV
jgi:hypothetical protein